MPTIPPEVYGPAGLLVFLVAAVWRLWRLHEAEDARRDRLLDSLTQQLPDLIGSNKMMASTIGERLAEAEEAPLEEPVIRRKVTSELRQVSSPRRRSRKDGEA